jgi:hypothetical protein
MKFTAQINPIQNPNVSNLSEQEQWMYNADKKLKSRKPQNAPNVVSQKVQSEHNRTLIQTTSVSPDIETGIWELANVYNNQYLQKPTAYKLININDLNLRVNISWQQTAPFTSAPTPDGDYSMYYYVVIEKQPQGLFTTEEWYLVLKFEFNYDNTAQEFTWTEQTRNFRLKDTIDSRQIYAIGSDNYPDFTIDPEKITQAQYEELTSEDVTLNIISGFDLGQLDSLYTTPNPVLSANNKAHFEYFLYGNTAIINQQTFFDITPTLVFTYSGLFADFTPVS